MFQDQQPDLHRKYDASATAVSVETQLKVIVTVKGQVGDDPHAHDAICPMSIPEEANWATLKSRLDGSTRVVVVTLCQPRGRCESSVLVESAQPATTRRPQKANGEW